MLRNASNGSAAVTIDAPDRHARIVKHKRIMSAYFEPGCMAIHAVELLERIRNTCPTSMSYQYGAQASGFFAIANFRLTRLHIVLVSGS